MNAVMSAIGGSDVKSLIRVRRKFRILCLGPGEENRGDFKKCLRWGIRRKIVQSREVRIKIGPKEQKKIMDLTLGNVRRKTGIYVT